MSKTRNKQNCKLPKNLYVTGGYYSYKHPIEKRHIGLGRNRAKAVMAANAANRGLVANTIMTRHAEALINLLSREEIVQAALSRTALCGIYFLINKGHIVYVGQSTNIHMRIAKHIGTKEFDSFHFVECDRFILDEVEAAYIVALNPPLNRDVSLIKARDGMSISVCNHSTVQADVKTGD